MVVHTKLSELKIIDLFYFNFILYFHFHYFPFLNLGLGVSMMSHITVTHLSYITKEQTL